jgi:hypothetical protein
MEIADSRPISRPIAWQLLLSERANRQIVITELGLLCSISYMTADRFGKLLLKKKKRLWKLGHHSKRRMRQRKCLHLSSLQEGGSDFSQYLMETNKVVKPQRTAMIVGLKLRFKSFPLTIKSPPQILS